MHRPDFRWWMGIVEDRADPEKMGRYRVRILGYHTESQADLPTKDLPWATPVMPVTSSSNTGVSETPYLVEGSAVIGFFSDGEDEQQPVIIGSLPGMPQQKNTDPNIGFSDPTGADGLGEYPRYLNEPDISKLARDGAAEKHESLIDKRERRTTDVHTARAPSVATMLTDKAGKDYTGGVWEEPHPRFGSTSSGTYTAAGQQPTFGKGTTSVYPFNQVKETESGHVFEIDDTPDNGRIHEYHNSGTFREIQADGTRITKVVGKDYEIVANGKNVLIQGGCNVTIRGDCKLRVDGDYYQEIDGDYFLSVTGDKIVKVNGNHLTEVGTDLGVNVNKNKTVRVGLDNTDTIIGDNTQTIGGNSFKTVGGNVTSISVGSTSHTSILGYKVMSTTGNVSMNAPLGDFKALSLNMSLSAALNQTVTAAVQLIEGSTNQTLSGVVTQSVVSPIQLFVAATSQSTTTPLQSISASTRSITGVTSHTGAYNITGNLTVVGTASGSIVRQGTIILGTHKHTVGGSAAPLTGTPTA